MIRINAADYWLYCDSWAELIEGIDAHLPLPCMTHQGKPYPTLWVFIVNGTHYSVSYNPNAKPKRDMDLLSATEYNDADLADIHGMGSWTPRFAFDIVNVISSPEQGRYVWNPRALGMAGRGEEVIRFLYGTAARVDFSCPSIARARSLKNYMIERGWTCLEGPPPPPARPELIVGALYTSVKAQFLIKRLEVKPNASH